MDTVAGPVHREWVRACSILVKLWSTRWRRVTVPILIPHAVLLETLLGSHRHPIGTRSSRSRSFVVACVVQTTLYQLKILHVPGTLSIVQELSLPLTLPSTFQHILKIWPRPTAEQRTCFLHWKVARVFPHGPAVRIRCSNPILGLRSLVWRKLASTSAQLTSIWEPSE